MPWIVVFCLWLGSLLVAGPAVGQESRDIRPARPNETVCPTPLLQNAPGSWRPQEIWSWNERICLGMVADLSEYLTEARGGCNVSEVGGWSKRRILTPEFVQLILFYEPFRSVMPRHGFRVRCAEFVDTLDLSDGQFDHAIKIENSYFAKGIKANNLKSGQDFSLEESRLTRPVTTLGEPYSVVAGRPEALTARNMQIDGSIILKTARFETGADLSGSLIGGNLDASGGAVFGRDLNLYGLHVDGNVYLSQSVFDRNIILVGADVAGEVAANESAVKADLNAYRLRVGGDLQVRQAHLINVYLLGAQIGANLDLRDTSFVGRFDLTGGNVDGDLILATSELTWDKADFQTSRNSVSDLEPALILRNVSAESLQDTREWWGEIKSLDLLGFAYERIGGLKGAAQETMANRDIDWIVQQWIEKQPESTITAQPYQQLANTLRRYGHHDLADEVVVRLNDHLRENSESLETRISLSLAWLFDYGKSPYWAFIYFALLVLIGGVLFERTPEGRGWSFPDRFLFTFDALLPAVSLRKAHGEIEIKNWVRYYFYFLQISGYIFVFMFLRSVDKIIQRHSLF